MLYYRVICIKLLLNGMLSAWLADSPHTIRAVPALLARMSACMCECVRQQTQNQIRTRQRISPFNIVWANLNVNKIGDCFSLDFVNMQQIRIFYMLSLLMRVYVVVVPFKPFKYILYASPGVLLVSIQSIELLLFNPTNHQRFIFLNFPFRFGLLIGFRFCFGFVSFSFFTIWVLLPPPPHALPHLE